MTGRTLPEIALRLPITVVMVTITVVGLGAIAWQRIPIEFIPKMDVPFIGCVIPYPGATPEQVENEVAIPAEGEFRTIPHVRSISTTSNSEGCYVRLNFDWDTNMANATADVRDRIERLKLSLPSGVDQVLLRRFSAGSLPVLVFSLYREGDDEELAHLARTVVQPRLLRIDGVADVSTYGRPEREVQIDFDQAALRSMGLALYQVISALQASSLNVPVGDITEGKTKYYIRVSGEFSSPDDLRRLVIGPNGLRLGDVAKVSYAPRTDDYDFSIDGKGGAFLIVLKESEANTIDVCRSVHAELERLRGDPALEGVEMFVFLDQSKIILSALDGLIEAGKHGAVLAILVLLLFLRRFRTTLIVALAIPTSLVTAIVFMYFAGMTLNVVTMISLMIGVGSLVDDSIVVIENIYRHQQLGRSPAESAKVGAFEVSTAITASTLTTIVVFIPIFYMQTGEMATYMRQFAVPITVSQLASLAIAMTLIPLAASRMKPLRPFGAYAWGRRARAGLGRFAGSAVSAGVTHFLRGTPLVPLKRAYASFLRGCMHWRMATLLVIAVFSAFTYQVAGKHVSMQRMPTVDAREVDISVSFQQNFDIDMARDRMRAVSASINEVRERLGIRSVILDHDRSKGRIRIYLVHPEDLAPGEKLPCSTEEAMTYLRARIPAALPGVELQFQVAETSESSTRMVSVNLRGDDSGLLSGYAQRFKKQMEALPGISNVTTDIDRAKEEMRIKVDDLLAVEAGVTPMLIAQTVDFALRGIRLPDLKQGGREIPVWAQFREEDRKTTANLDNVAVLSSSGMLVSLKQLVTFDRAQSPQALRRENGKNVVTITARMGQSDMRSVEKSLLELTESFVVPRGYSVELGSEFTELRTNVSNFTMALWLAIILIYIVMGALFESFFLPLSILTSVPLALLGVVWAMFLTGTPMDTIGFIGVILLTGIVVKNGIVIIDHINQLRNGGMARLDAISQASLDRFRPVMMTALTTVLGSLPMALEPAAGGQVSFCSMGRTLIGGLITGTILTLVVVPLFYSLIDDVRAWFGSFFADLASLAKLGARAPVSTPAEPAD